ncbi:hypothetical protein L21SP5_00240 [Salinivirga cyanobacteriivorans]|uniref:Uncharacterized protein n=2 Tax=Salinivirga cyanobacteriivorans TaxID=1307839 RepID=A0A0S2HV46_9BACT|nr:hypothetical protein L21SP5_00240 [Salinivirga cyanobacteriivorans]
MNFLPELNQSIELFAGTIENGEFVEEDIKWIHKIEEPEKMPVLSITLDSAYFEQEDSIILVGQQFRLLASNVEKTIYLKKLQFELSTAIETFCDSILVLKSQFDSLSETLEPVPEQFDPVVFNHATAYYERGMSQNTTKTEDMEWKMDSTLITMHDLDVSMDSITNYDDLYEALNTKKTSTEIWQAFKTNIINVLPDADPLLPVDSLKNQYTREIREKVYEILEIDSNE